MTIDCRRITDIAPSSAGWISVDLDDIDLGFIADIPVGTVVHNMSSSASELLDEIDGDDIVAYCVANGLI